MENNIYRGGLPFNLDDLINRRSIEGSRLEFKKIWSNDIKKSVIRTICAFANDFLNLNGGYIILGIEEQNGAPILPPIGMDDHDIDRIQRELIGECKGYISPDYLPHLFIEQYQEKTLIIIWAPAGDNRPYEAPKRSGRGKSNYIRSGSSTIEAEGDLKRQLYELASKIPFDDRRSLNGRLDDISIPLVKKYLNDVRSNLSSISLTPWEIFRRLRLLVKINDHEIPRNIALLFFNEDPDRFFPGSYIEVVQYGDDAGGDLIEEKEFRGTIPDQIRSCLNYLDGLGGVLLKKIEGQAEVERTVPYPYESMEEALVNAVYHRSYEYPPEPVKVYMYPDRMEITSYPGPVPGITIQNIQEGKIPAVPARNRRIGEFLKDLRLAEMRGTGIPKIQRKMRENGSPEAKFIFDEDRTFFTSILPVHPRYRVLHALRESSHLWAIGEKAASLSHLERAFENQPNSGAIASQLIEYSFYQGREDLAQKTFSIFENQSIKSGRSLPYTTMARMLISNNKQKEAIEFLKKMPPTKNINDLVESAILYKRTGDLEQAHHLFEEAYSENPDDTKTVQEFARTKIELAKRMKTKSQIRKKLNREAEELLRRAIQLCGDDKIRLGWCWFELARTLEWLRSPKSEVEAAFLKARALLPEENMIRESYERWNNKNR